jgi:hypothetical protein
MKISRVVEIDAEDYYEEQAILARYPGIIFIASGIKGKTLFYLPIEKYEEVLQFRDYFEGRIKTTKER